MKPRPTSSAVPAPEAESHGCARGPLLRSSLHDDREETTLCQAEQQARG